MSSALTRIVERFVKQALAGAGELARLETLGALVAKSPIPAKYDAIRKHNLMPPVYGMLHARNKA